MSTEIASTPTVAAPPPADVNEILVPPNPISDEPPQADQKPEVKEKQPEKPLSARDALKAAAEKIDKQETGAKDKAAEEKPTDKARDETGKFKSAEPAKEPGKDAEKVEAKPLDKTVPHNEAPSRFSPEAKAKWAEADETVRAETHRAIKELEQGHAKYKQDATDYEPFREFHKLAREKNVDPVAALRQYVGIDQLLASDFKAGIERICANKGISLKEFATQVLNQPADKAEQESSAYVRRLEAQIAEQGKQLAAVAQKVNGVDTHISEQQNKAFEAEVETFAADKPLFNELSEVIVSHIANNGLSLQDAYDKALSDAQAMAQRLGFIPQAQAATIPDADLEAQTLRGQKSIAGAPSAGSAPATHKPSPNIKAALLRAMSATGA
jgi:hypothetical protein